MKIISWLKSKVKLTQNLIFTDEAIIQNIKEEMKEIDENQLKKTIFDLQCSVKEMEELSKENHILLVELCKMSQLLIQFLGPQGCDCDCGDGDCDCDEDQCDSLLQDPGPNKNDIN